MCLFSLRKLFCDLCINSQAAQGMLLVLSQDHHFLMMSYTFLSNGSNLGLSNVEDKTRNGKPGFRAREMVAKPAAMLAMPPLSLIYRYDGVHLTERAAAYGLQV